LCVRAEKPRSCTKAGRPEGDGMTEEDQDRFAVMESSWLACSDPDEMLQLLVGRASGRRCGGRGRRGRR
jgi:hypothetical protein